jgi:hypothetical protein
MASKASTTAIIMSITAWIATAFIRRIVLNKKQSHPASGPIDSIPPEIASMIIEYLGLRDRKRLRLASKSWATAGERFLFPTNAFQLEALRDNISRLRNVSQNPYMASSIHHLHIDIIAVSHGKFVWFYRSKAFRFGKLKAFRMYLNALASHEGYCRGTILDELIPSLTQLKSIAISGYDGSYCWDAEWRNGLYYPPAAKLARWLYKNIKKVDFGDDSISDLRLKSVMNTISNLPSSISLESLTIYSFPLLAFWEWDEKEETMIDSTHCMHESFGNLRELMLTIKPGLHMGMLRIRLRDRRPYEDGVKRGALDNRPSALSPLVGRSLAALILSMQKLQNLNLNWCYEMRYLSDSQTVRDEWGKLFFTGTFPVLTSLCLCSFETTEDKLLDFLNRHRDTLTHLSLDSEIIKGGTRNGCYKRLFTHLRDQFHLQKFEFALQSNMLNGWGGCLYDREWKPVRTGIYTDIDRKEWIYRGWPLYRWPQLLEEYVIKGLKWPMLNDDPSDNGNMLFWEPLPEFGVEKLDPSSRHYFY